MSMQQYAVKNMSSTQSLRKIIIEPETIVAGDMLISVYMLGIHNLFCNDPENPLTEFFENVSSSR